MYVICAKLVTNKTNPRPLEGLVNYIGQQFIGVNKVSRDLAILADQAIALTAFAKRGLAGGC